MSHLFLVRHGQASFLEPDYDKLSAKGELQARLLGEYWARHNVVFDRVYTGPRTRQKDTAHIVGKACESAGLPWPEPVVLPAFDEFQAEAVIAQTFPPMIERDEHIRAMHQAFLNAADKAQRFKTFQRVFEAVISKWAHGEIPTEGVERWPEFCDRVNLALRTLAQNGSRGQRIVVFSSGGPVGVAMQKALGLSTEATLRSAWMVHNCAYSDFLFSPGRFTLNSYNASPHLVDPAHLTYR